MQDLEKKVQDLLAMCTPPKPPEIKASLSDMRTITMIKDLGFSKPITLGDLIFSLQDESCDVEILKKKFHINPAKDDSTFHRWLRGSQKPSEKTYVIRYISNHGPKKIRIRFHEEYRYDILSTMMFGALKAKCFTVSANSGECLKEEARNQGYPATGGNYDCCCSGCRKWWFQTAGQVKDVEHLKELIQDDKI